MRVIPVPNSLEERTFDQLLSGMGQDGRLLLDARRTRWIDPYGMLGLLAVGEVAARRGDRPVLQLPDAPEVGGYLARMGFLEQAERNFELHGGVRAASGGPSDILLEITPIRSHADVHTVLDRIQDRTVILVKQLNYPGAWAMQFSAILSEVCQNIIEHAGAGGWVATQTYNWQRRLGRRVAVIAVMDLGVGFRGSLAGQHATRYGERWGDGAALEAAFIHGLTRFHDPSRGQGLQHIRRQVGRMAGKVSVRSGSARIADVPDWDDAPPLEEHLAPFPGAQICIILPARAAAQGAS